MKATILIPVAVLAAAGAATAVGVSMTSSADDVPAAPIVVHAPQQAPGSGDQVPDTGRPGAQVPAAPGPATPPRVTAEPKVPPPPPPVDVPAPPPAITHDDDWDDDDGGWDD